MHEEGAREGGVRAARELVDLALDFADRAQAAEADLIAEFRTAAATLAAGLGPVVIESDDDEQLLLRADGVLAGEVLDEATGVWENVESPEDVTRYYDPTDLFLDLADALVERFPELAPEFPEVGDRTGSRGPLEAGPAAGDFFAPASAAFGSPGAPREAPWSQPEDAPGLSWDQSGLDDPGASAPAARPAIDATLENLRRSGVLSEAEFERLKAQLEG